MKGPPAGSGLGGSPIRAILILIVVLASLVPLSALASDGGGAAYGVEIGNTSAGFWDIWHVYMSAPGWINATLTWSGSADYDMTLWRAGADSDGQLSSNEELATSWTISHFGPEAVSRSVAASGAPYVLTVEAVDAGGQPYHLHEEGGSLVRTCHIVSIFTNGNPCVWSAEGTKFR